MSTLTLPHALVAVHGPQDLRWLGQSAEFQDEWRPLLEDMCRRFGDRPAGVRCPLAIFAQPLGAKHVVVAQAADQGTESDQPPHALGFHFLVFKQAEYADLGGDPFTLAAAVPVNWRQRSVLPSLALTPPPLQRSVAMVCEVLQRADGPTLLGATQALVDGSRVAWVRPQPDTELISSLWRLLPTSTRTYLWPASFAFGNALGFDAVVVAQISKDEFDHQYLSEEQAENYPEGSYELAVQSAAEAGDQAWLDSVLARRSRREVWRLGWWLLAALIILTVVFGVVKWLAQ
jgi:hypothetical protein